MVTVMPHVAANNEGGSMKFDSTPFGGAPVGKRQRSIPA